MQIVRFSLKLVHIQWNTPTINTSSHAHLINIPSDIQYTSRLAELVSQRSIAKALFEEECSWPFNNDIVVLSPLLGGLAFLRSVWVSRGDTKSTSIPSVAVPGKLQNHISLVVDILLIKI